MSEKIKVSAVSYLNTKPLLYGLLRNPIAVQLDLQLDIPSVCAEKLRTGQADLSLAPIAIIPELDHPHIISDYCIGTKGTVKTVCIYSVSPLKEVKRLLLDYQSRTSVALAKLLLRDFWGLQPELIAAQRGFENQIDKDTAALIIGDRTMGLDMQYPYVYDLGEAWLQHTGLPFVFAAWVSNRPLPEPFIRQFNQALQEGLDHIPELIYLLPEQVGFDLKAYFTENISYHLDADKKKAMSLFLQHLNPEGPAPIFAYQKNQNHLSSVSMQE
jgi:chorismate dehydratase